MFGIRSKKEGKKMGIVAFLGRVLFSLIFITSSFAHFSQGAIQYASSMGVPMASILVPCAGILAFFGGLSILLGYKAKIGAWLIVLFLVPVTLMMHSFWQVEDPQAAMLQYIMFMKNLSMLGGALVIAYFGSGPLSIKH
jgi:putative oxidoreductase